jgi:DNA-binding MarR family transcriptional regulator
MKELHQIKDLRQAKALMNPWRIALLNLLREPKTCLEIAEALELSQQRVNNNIRELVKAGLVKKVASRQKRNLVEAVYQASSKTFWFSPQLALGKTKRQARDVESLNNLLRLSEQLQDDASQLLGKTDAASVPSFGVTADVVLRSAAEREAFAKDLLKALHGVLEKYQGRGAGAETFTTMIVSYPQPGAPQTP